MLGVALLLAGSSAPVHAERFQIRTYSVEQGLAQSDVTAMFQDRNGYLWFATSGGGVSRFDGHRFENYGVTEGLPSSVVSAIAEDARGVWVGTDHGLAVFDGARFQSALLLPGFNGAPIDSLALGSEGALLVAGGGVVYREERGVFRPLYRGRPGPVLVAADGTIWLGGDGLTRLPGGGRPALRIAAGLPSEGVEALSRGRSGNLWVGTDHGPCSLEGEVCRPLRGAAGLLGQEVLSLLEDRSGTLWLGLRSGVARLAAGHLTVWTTDDGLAAGAVDSLLEDSEGHLWVGTRGGGAAELVGNTFSYFGVDDGLPGPLVMGFGRGLSGDRFILTTDGLGRRRGGAAAERRRIETVRGCRSVLVAFLHDRRDRLWVGGSQGLFQVADGTCRSVTLTARRIGVRALAEDASGNMWIGLDRGVFVRRGSGLQAVAGGEGLLVNSFFVDRRGTLWAAATTGLYRFGGGALAHLPGTGPVLNRESVSTIIEDRDGTLWLGMFGFGLIHLGWDTAGKVKETLLSTREGLASEWIYFLVFDRLGRMWVGTGRGLDRLDAVRLQGTAEGELRHYGAEEGYLGVESNQRAALLDDDGSLWFGTVKGALRYHAAAEAAPRVVPRTRLTGVLVGQRRVDWGARGLSVRDGLPLDLKLPYDQNNLAFTYVGVSFDMPERVVYSVRLKGLEAEWRPADANTSATYPSLPPGSYTLEVRTANGDGQYGEPVRFSFTVLPPFWRTHWFVLLACFAAAGLVHVAYRLRVAQFKRRQRRLEDLVGERTGQLVCANAELDRLARTDALTGLANKRALDERLELACRQSRRNGNSFSVLLLDVDFFKRYNDTYGHQAGDACLQAIAAVLKKVAARPSDLAARFGGEEFVVLLPDTLAFGALAVADLLSRELAALALPHAGSPAAAHVTVSIGCATATGEEVQASRLLAQADEALYRAKANGRNRVQVGVAAPRPLRPARVPSLAKAQAAAGG